MVVAGYVMLWSASVGNCTVLGIKETQFTIDGNPTFLLGISYYGGCGAPAEFVKADFEDMRAAGFNWVRVWAVWPYFGEDMSVIGPSGEIRAPYMSRLRNLIVLADEMGMIVDVTFTPRQPVVQFNPATQQDANFAAYERGIVAVARQLKPYRNIYFDLGNERDVRDARFVSTAQIATLRAGVKEIEPERLVTASCVPRDANAMRKLTAIAALDFITPHLSRNASAPSHTFDQTAMFFAWMDEVGRRVPVHYQEPFRRGYNDWQPGAADYLTDLGGAVRAGAAGWCLHNGATRNSEEKRPLRSFDMTQHEGRLFDQLDEVELAVVRGAAEVVRQAQR